MLKLNASFSKKVPADSEYSSQQYHASVEIELPDVLAPDELRQRIHSTFALVRESVETELKTNGNGKVAQPAPVQPVQPVATQPAQPKPNPKGTASGKQVAFLLDLAARQGLTPAALNAKALECFGCPTVQGLTRKQASDLIDQLSTARAAA